MTDEDLNRRFDQMERVLTAHMERLSGAQMDHINQRLDGMDQRLDGMDQRLDGIDQRLDGMDQRLSRFDERLDGSAQALVGNLSDLRNEFNERFDRLDRRTERTENSVNAILSQVAGMSKSLTEGERIDTLHEVRLAAQQRAIDELYRRIADLERRNPPAA